MLRKKTLAFVLASALLVATALPALAAPNSESPDSPIVQAVTTWLAQWSALAGIFTAESQPVETKQGVASGPPHLGNDDEEAASQAFSPSEEDSSPSTESGVIVIPGG